MANRRGFLAQFSQLCAGALAVGGVAVSGSEAQAQTRAASPPARTKLKIMMKSAWGSDDPTRASFPFVHGIALADAGHEVQIYLTGEATYLMRQVTAESVFPVGWPPLKETLAKVVAKRIPIFA